MCNTLLFSLLLLAGCMEQHNPVTPEQFFEKAYDSFAGRDWSQYRFDASRTGFNRFESILGPGNVANLTELWRYQTGGPVSCSPTVARGYLHVNSGDGQIYTLLSSNGQLVWAYPLTAADPCGGVAVDRATVYSGSGTGAFLALGVSDGRVVWTDPLGESVDAPALLPTYNIVVYENEGNIIVARIDKLGNHIWTYNLGEGFVHSEPAVWGGMVYVTTTTDANISTLFSINAESGLLQWTFQPPPPSFGLSDPTVDRGDVYVTDGNGTIYQIDAFTGEMIWSFTPPPPPPDPTWVTVGRVTIADGSSDASESPVSVSRTYVAGSDGHLRVLDARSGALVLDIHLGVPVHAPLTFANGVLYAGADDGILRAIDAVSGQVLWSSEPTGGPILSMVAVVNGVVYACFFDGSIRAFGLTERVPLRE
jgi:glucose dehydrogenase